MGLPGPHPPCDLTLEAPARYEGVPMPKALESVGGIDGQPAEQRRLRENLCRIGIDSITWRMGAAPAEIDNLWRDHGHREQRDRLKLKTMQWYLKSTLHVGRKPRRKPQVALQG